MRVTIHERVHQRHPEICEQDVIYSWRNFYVAAVRVPGEREMRVGFDLKGRELEMVGVLTVDGWLVYHAMTPPSKKTRTEIKRARGGRP